MTDPISNALTQLTAYGLQLDQFECDGKLRRVKTTDDKGSKKSGWYVAHEFTLDSGRTVITGRFGNWKVSDEPQEFKFDATFTESEKAAFKAKQEAQRQAAAKEKRARQKQAAARAEKSWPNLPKEGHSDYLARKKIYGFVCRYSRGWIAIPLYKNNKLVGLQWIKPDGEKIFLTGTEKEGASTIIQQGSDDLPRILCEGYSTGCSLAMAKPEHTVEACHDAGNLLVVAKAYIKSKIPFMVAADNDHQLAVRRPDIGNKGINIAREIQRLSPKTPIYWPDFLPEDSGSDFNDLHVSKSLDAVREIFNRREPQALVSEDSQDNGFNELCPPFEGEQVDDDPPPDPDWQLRLTKVKSRGGPLKIEGTASNIALIFEHDPEFSKALSYCDFSYRIIKRREIMPQVTDGEWIDSDTSAALIWMARKYGFEPSDPKLAHALVNVAKHNRFHPVRDYLENVVWDKKERLANWLADVYESDAPPDYLAAAGKKFLIGAVARIFRPGCKMDNVLILEGEQGLRKSTSVHKLFGEWFSDSPIPLGDKDSYQNIQGIWCHELAELDSFNKAESTTAKNFFTQTRDRYRPSYGHRAEDFPRQTVFVGTTNQDEYLKDYTGNRRYWPVKCRIANLELIEAYRDQYWAEAVHLYKQGATWWIESEAERQLFEAEQDSRLQVDPWQYHIERYLTKDAGEYVTSAEILSDAIKKDAGHVTKADQNRISPIMQAIGWKHKKKRIWVGTEKLPRWVYVRPEKPSKVGELE